jgi:hypothetical protein
MKEYKSLSRRDFLKLGGLSLAGMALPPALQPEPLSNTPPNALLVARVTTDEISIYETPDFESDEVSTCKRDELLYVYKKVTSPYGPLHNPRWYEIDDGYVHTGHIQVVETHLNEVVYNLPEGGQLAEITVPISLSFQNDSFYGWRPLYRLYYQSVHWVREIGYGPNGQPWYAIKDDLLPITYYIPAPHMRLIPPEELTPLATNVPQEQKEILVNRTTQKMAAFENGVEIFETSVSTGMPYNIPGVEGPSTITPLGDFYISIKMPVRHMGDGNITSDIFAYELPGVPWVSYFYRTGVAFHGCYWHDNYGTEMSHGCVNMRPEEAKWLWRWATPESPVNERLAHGIGTKVRVVV